MYLPKLKLPKFNTTYITTLPHLFSTLNARENCMQLFDLFYEHVNPR